MKIDVVVSNPAHPVWAAINEWVSQQKREGHDAELLSRLADLRGGDVLFLMSCSFIVDAEARSKYQKVLVLHAGDLPLDRGWSPHIWNIVEGNNTLTLTMLEAEDKVDSGDVWFKAKIQLQGHELFDEINAALFEAELALMSKAVAEFSSVCPLPQDNDITPTYRSKRSPADSQIDPNKSLVEQFGLLRTADPDRFPAFFDHMGCRYKIRLEKMNDE